MNIEEQDVWMEHQRASQCFLTVFCFADNFKVIFKAQDALDPLPQKCVIVCY